MADQADSTLRTCKHCQIEKPLSGFVKSSQGRGWRHQCRDCRSGERRDAYVKREGEYQERDSEAQRVKRRECAKRQRGRFVWQAEWLNVLPAKPCARCKIDLPANPAWFPPNTANKTGLSSWCRACTARHYDENRAKRNAEQRERYRRLQSQTPEVLRASRRSWQRRNLEKKKAYERWWREQNLERAKAQCVASQNKRRALIKNVSGSFTADDVAAMKSAQKGRCWYCLKKLGKFHVEHRIPLSRGGTNGPSNLVLACPPCNLSKGAKMPWELENPLLL